MGNRVRDGNGWFPYSWTPANSFAVRSKLHNYHKLRNQQLTYFSIISSTKIFRKSPRPISISRLKMLPLLHLWPIYVVFCDGTYWLVSWEILSYGGLRTYMLSALIRLEHSYRAFTLGRITRTLEVPSSRSSRTKEDSVQISYACTGYGPNCLTTFWTQLACRFNGRTAQPLERTTAPPVIPMVTFIRWAMALPYRTTGSLYPTFVPVRLVCLTVKLPFAIALNGWFPTNLREPLNASVTF